uniref:B30.2/SPRY domain-containing protein n=1 Tax=Lepisosteus oculatus TaxID=7918 RepID=W5LZ13_LEPOC
ALGSQPSVSLHSPGGDQAQLLCRSEGWFPQPAVIWTDRDGNEVTSQPPTVSSRQADSMAESRTKKMRHRGDLGMESRQARSQVRNLNEAQRKYLFCFPGDYFPEPSGWMVALFLTVAVILAASVLLIYKFMEAGECLSHVERCRGCAAGKLHLLHFNHCLCGGKGHPCKMYSSAVTLDPDTAHCQLKLSEDGKRVRLGEEEKDLSDNPHRFDSRFCVVSREAFTSGRHYWEVEVNDLWRIGVTRESAERKGGFSFSPQQGYWCLDYYALTDPETRLPLSLRPRKLGVCVDIEERKVSFYTVESRAHVYTFTDMVFTQGEKIYPVFWTEDLYKDLVLLP